MKKKDLIAVLRSTEAALDEQTEMIRDMQSRGRRDEHSIAKLKNTVRYFLNAAAVAMAGTPPEASSYFWAALFGSELAAMIDIDIEQGHLVLARVTVKNQLGITEGASATLVETRRVVLEKLNQDKGG